MCTRESLSAIGLVQAGVAGLVEADVVGMTDGQVRDWLLTLVRVGNQVDAVIVRLVGSFEVRGLAKADGCCSTRSWLGAFGLLSGGRGAAVVRHAAMLGRLPVLAAAAGRGEVSVEQLVVIARLVERVGVDKVVEVDQILAQACVSLAPADVARLCERVLSWLDPDGAEPDPEQEFARRGVSVGRDGQMVRLRGQLDAEGGALLATALDALMTPPTADDTRTAGQRRADALAELARLFLTQGQAPTVGGVRPQIGVLITPSTLMHNPDPDPEAPGPDDPDHPDPDDLDHDAGGTDHTDDGENGENGENGPNGGDPTGGAGDASRGAGGAGGAGRGAAAGAGAAGAGAGGGRAGGGGGKVGRVEPAWMQWFGDIPTALAQRLACDGDIWRIVLDPTTGLPLDVGRTHRLVPHWMRKALHARDRGCRWPGCLAPAPWTDAHHVTPWYAGGTTAIDVLLSLCRWHHSRVHEGRWRITLDPATGEVTVRRPDGRPYEITASQPWTGPNTRRNDPTPPGRTEVPEQTGPSGAAPRDPTPPSATPPPATPDNDRPPDG